MLVAMTASLNDNDPEGDEEDNDADSGVCLIYTK